MDRGGVLVLVLIGIGAYFLLSNSGQAASVPSPNAGTGDDGSGIADTSGIDWADPPADASSTANSSDASSPSVWQTLTNAVTNWSATVDFSTLQNPNVQAFLTLIRTGEGTLGQSGYNELFGGGHFSSFATHPDIVVNASGYSSTAAGAYQILYKTWTGLVAKYPSVLTDFSPQNQDFAALALISQAGALANVIAGNWVDAINACNKVWASLPNSPYGQPTLTMDRALNIIAANGGTSASDTQVA